MEQEQVIEEQNLDETPPEAPPEIAPEVVERAKLMGHIPKEEFKGDPERWVPADKYVERAENLMPILRSQLGKYEDKITTLQTTVESQRKTTEKLLKMSEKIGQQSYDQAMADIAKKQLVAVEESDVDTFKSLEEEKGKLTPPEPIVEEAPQDENPIFNAWKANNEWMDTDPSMALFANAYGAQYKETNPNASYQDILNATTEKVKSEFAHKFENLRRDDPPPVDSGGTGGGQQQSGGKTYNDLPADAKAQCDAWVKDGTVKSKEQYAKDYFEV